MKSILARMSVVISYVSFVFFKYCKTFLSSIASCNADKIIGPEQAKHTDSQTSTSSAPRDAAMTKPRIPSKKPTQV